MFLYKDIAFDVHSKSYMSFHLYMKLNILPFMNSCDNAWLKKQIELGD